MFRWLPLLALLFAERSAGQSFGLVGPDAPVLDLSWSNGYMISLSDPPGSNNAAQNYQELDPSLTGAPDPSWNFQGYLVFQVRSDFNPIAENCFDPDRARLVASSDIADGISTLSGFRHFHMDSAGVVLADTCYVEQVNGTDAGLQFTYTITIDGFTGMPFEPQDTVCFLALAYATNGYGVDTACGAPDQVLLSTGSPDGAVRTTCVNAITAAVPDGISRANTALWPVPADDALFWNTDVPPIGIRLINTLGQVARSFVPATVHGSLPVSDLPEGTYVLAIEHGDEQLEHRTVRIAHF